MVPPPVNRKVDPGWNDPPTLSYDASNPPPKSRITNKRVPFPLSSNKPLNVIDPILPVSTQVNLNKNKSNNLDSETTLNRVLVYIESSLKNVNDPGDDIRNKIEILKSMWKENKLDSIIQKHVLDMSKYIAEGDNEKANECQLQLMMENATLCEPWIVGFRQLTHNFKM